MAPSGPFDRELLVQGLARLSIFDLHFSAALLERQQGYLAGSDQERLDELQAAFDDPEGEAIWIARGGYGLGRLVDALDWTSFMKRPKWIVGFSDATVLHAEAWKRRVVSLHAANGTTLARAHPDDFQGVLQSLMSETGQKLIGKSEVSGETQGPLVGGNLTVLMTEAAAGRLKIPEGAVLLLEDVTETSYRIDRMLEALRSARVLQRCSGLIFGEFSDCSPGKFQVPVERVVSELCSSLSLPSASAFQVGHGARNVPLKWGSQARLSVPVQGPAQLHLDPPSDD